MLVSERRRKATFWHEKSACPHLAFLRDFISIWNHPGNSTIFTLGCSCPLTPRGPFNTHHVTLTSHTSPSLLAPSPPSALPSVALFAGGGSVAFQVQQLEFVRLASTGVFDSFMQFDQCGASTSILYNRLYSQHRPVNTDVSENAHCI
jgi:hypothetical protein